MNNPNISAAENPNNTNKVLLFIFLGVLVITIALASFYLYTQHRGAKNNKASVSQGTPNPNIASQNDVDLIHKSAPLVYTDSLSPATVGKPYKAAVRAAVFNLNVQIAGKAISGLPPGLQLTCSTEYNSPAFPKDLAAKNSLCTCTIEGIPQQSGKFTVRVSFSIQGGISNSYNDLPLVVNP